MSKHKKSEKAKEPAKEKGKVKEKKKADGVGAEKKTPVRRKKTASTPAAKSTVTIISQEEISLRAYYIAESRRSRGESGDEISDWLEAERQLRIEKGL